MDLPLLEYPGFETVDPVLLAVVAFSAVLLFNPFG